MCDLHFMLDTEVQASVSGADKSAQTFIAIRIYNVSENKMSKKRLKAFHMFFQH